MLCTLLTRISIVSPGSLRFCDVVIKHCKQIPGQYLSKSLPLPSKFLPNQSTVLSYWQHVKSTAKENQHHHPENTRRSSLHDSITLWQNAAVAAQCRKCHSQTLVMGLHSEAYFLFLRMHEVCSWFAVCRTQPVFRPHHTPQKGGGFPFSFSV
jgi:hypothetical protein